MDQGLLNSFQNYILENNPFVAIFKSAADQIIADSSVNLVLMSATHARADRRYDAVSSNEVAALLLEHSENTVVEGPPQPKWRSIVLTGRDDDQLTFIKYVLRLTAISSPSLFFSFLARFIHSTTLYTM